MLECSSVLPRDLPHPPPITPQGSQFAYVSFHALDPEDATIAASNSFRSSLSGLLLELSVGLPSLPLPFFSRLANKGAFHGSFRIDSRGSPAAPSDAFDFNWSGVFAFSP